MFGDQRKPERRSAEAFAHHCKCVCRAVEIPDGWLMAEDMGVLPITSTQGALSVFLMLVDFVYDMW